MNLFRVLCTVILGMLWAAGSIAAQPIAGPGGNYWPAFCKTGSTAKVEVDNTSTLRIFFESTGKPAQNDFSGLTPGKCSWPDRAMTKEELMGYYGELFAQWSCPVGIGTCLVRYDAATHTFKGDFPWISDPAGRKFKMWIRKNGKHMRILGDTSPKIEFVN